MYMMPRMIDMGLLKDQEWPSEAHKGVASSVALCNPNVCTRDHLIEIVQAILKVPKVYIEKVTYRELVDFYNVSDVGMYEC